MLILWRLVHVFGFIFWFVGLLGTAGAQVAARKAPDLAGRRGAWSVVRRLQPWEIVGLVLAPVGGIFLTVGVYGHLFRGSPAFVHIKLLLAAFAIVCNLLAIAARRKASERLGNGDEAGFLAALKKANMFTGMATQMLPIAVIVVIAMKYAT